MPNINSPRYQRWFVQEQTAPLAFNQSGGVWAPSLAQLLRVDQGAMSVSRNAPYNRFPVLTGTKSEVPGIRGRKIASFSMRGLPIIPSGAAGSVGDLDKIFKNTFGKAATISAGVSTAYTFDDTGYFPFSLLGFVHGFPTMTSRALWSCFVSRMVINFNGPFLTADVDGFAGYMIASTGFAAYDAQAKAGLTTWPVEPVSPTITGSPIAGFGNGYTCTIDTQDISLRVRALSLTIETGYTPVADVYGSPYMAAVVGGARRVSLSLGNVLDDDSAALNDLKLKADTDNTTINASIVAGNVAGSIMTTAVNNIQPEAFNLRDNGPEVAFDAGTSFAHASSVSQTDDAVVTFT